MRARLLGTIGLAMALGGCSFAPRYARPATPVPNEWPAAAAGAATEGTPPADAIPWRSYFADERLRTMIDLALANNRDLRLAALNITRTEALYRIQRSELYPTVDAVTAGDVYRLPGKLAPDGSSHTVEQYTAQISTSWEIDLFGRIRSLNQAALEQYFATEHARRATQLSLVAAVASTYVTIAAAREDLALARATLAAHLSTQELIERSRQFGIASDLDYRQVQSSVEAARAAVAAYQGHIEISRHALDEIVGTTVPPDLLPDRVDTVAAVRDLEAGLPSEVLLRRPDILAAEHQLRAANASIGAARAAFFPRIALTAGVGTLSPELSSLFQSGTGTWSFAPQIVTPVFNAGRLRANVKVTETERAMAVAEYEKAVQRAFREVTDALSLRATLAEQRAAETALVTALDQTQRLSDARYQAGIDSYLSVLVADRALFVGQHSLVNTRLAEQVNLVTLYKVLGGGL